MAGDVSYWAEAWSALKIVGPWISGGLAGAALTLLAKHREARRKRRLIGIETILQKYSLPQTSTKNGFKPDDLRIVYQGTEYNNLALCTTRLKNIGVASVESQNLILLLPSNTTIIKKVIVSGPLDLPYEEEQKETTKGIEVVLRMERVEKDDYFQVALLVDCPNIQDFQCMPRGVDGVEYRIGTLTGGNDIESNICKALSLSVLFVLGHGFPFFAGAVQAMALIIMMPYLRNIIRYFLTSKRQPTHSVKIEGLEVHAGGTANIAASN